MSRLEGPEVMPGTVLQFYESKEILCGVVLAVKDSRFNVLSERNREINVTSTRVLHHGRLSLDLKLSRDEMLKRLASIAQRRKELMQQVDIREVWSLLQEEGEGFYAEEIAEFVFSKPLSDDQTAAVHQLLLNDRLYFQSKDGKFIPRSPDNVETRQIELEKEAEKERKLSECARWISAVWNKRAGVPPSHYHEELVETLRSYALFGQEAPEAAFIKDLFKLGSIPPHPQSAFRLLVRLGIWRDDENLLLHEFGLSQDFSSEAEAQAEEIVKSEPVKSLGGGREDLRDLDVFTVDSILTRDYDDALSLRDLGGDVFEVGIHIADAAELIPAGSPLDREAEQRASSIYLPDGRISMLPPSVSEGISSLKAGCDRLALSFLITFDASGQRLGSRIVPSIIRIREQLTYQDVNSRIDESKGLRILHELALKLREKRLERGAVILPLPEIQVYVNSAGMIQISRYEKETPSQILVSEWMIEANAAAANFLAERDIPAVFRNQAECRPETEMVQSEHELFHIYRRRRLFARAELSTEPKPHCSLAIPYYTTVTSPIRRYADLAVQRQLKHALLTDSAQYSKKELEDLITRISAVQSRIFTVQRKWTKYWLMKYLEQEDIENLSALVLDKNSRFAHLLIPDFLLETNAPVPENAKFRQGDKVRIHIEKVIPREELLKIQILEAPPRP